MEKPSSQRSGFDVTSEASFLVALYDSPSEAAALLLRAHSSKSHQRQSMIEVLWKGLSSSDPARGLLELDDAQKILILASFIPVLLGIGTDEKIYEISNGNTGTTSGSRSPGYHTLVFRCLVESARALLQLWDMEETPRVVKYFLQKASSLWQLLWVRRVTLFSDVASLGPDPTHHFRDSVILLLVLYGDVAWQSRNPPPITNFNSHLLIYCWAFTSDANLRPTAIPHLTNQFRVSKDDASYFPIKLHNDFMKDAVIDNGITVQALHLFLDDLMPSDLLHHDLHAHIYLLHKLVMAYDPNRFTRDVPLQVIQKLLRNLSVACQRQSCSEDFSEDIEGQIFDLSFRCMLSAVSVAPQGLVRIQEAPPMIMLAGKSAGKAFLSNKSEEMATSMRFFKFFSGLPQLAKGSAFEDEDTHKNLSKVQFYTRNAWLSTLRDIRSIVLVKGDTPSRFVQDWAQMGHIMGLSEKMEPLLSL